MREILFRGKAINRVKGASYRTNYKNGDWVYGLVTRLFDERFELPAEMTNTKGIGGIEVDYKTIGQFIGKEDKNGVKIFKGDIVKTKYGRLCQVVWFYSNAYNGWDLKPIGDVIHTKCPDEYDLWLSENLEVVGNVYEGIGKNG